MNRFERTALIGSAVALAIAAAVVLLNLRHDETETIAPRQVLTGHTGSVRAVAFFPDDKTLASVDDSSGFHFWNADSGRLLHTESLFGIRGVAFSPDGQTIAFLDPIDRKLRLWEVSTGDLRTLMESDVYFDAIVFSPDGQRMAGSIPGIYSRPRSSIQIWDVKSGALLQKIEGDWKFYSVAFSPDGERVVGPGAGNVLKIWDVKTGKALQTFHGHTYMVMLAAYSPDGETVASADQIQTVKIWDVKTGKALRTYEYGKKSADALVYSPDSKTLAVRHQKGVHIWDVKTGELLQKLLGLSKEYGGSRVIAYSPDGKTLAAADNDNNILIWDIGEAAPP